MAQSSLLTTACSTRNPPILIIGAGVAGLTLAQGLRQHNVPFRLFERHPANHRAQGHRFRISNDGREALFSIIPSDLQNLFDRTCAQQAPGPRYVDARKLEFAPADFILDPRNKPIDRTWIRRLLIQGLEDAVEYEKGFISYRILEQTQAQEQGLGQVEVSFADGTTAYGSMLVGADGNKSRVRQQLQPSRKLLNLERQIAWGRTNLTPDLKAQLPDDMLSWFMALDHKNNVQCIVEPVIWTSSVKEESQGRLPDMQDYMYWALCTAPPLRSPKSDAEKRAFLVDEVSKDWHPLLKLLFQEADYDQTACVPVLSSKPDIGEWENSKGFVTLIGDAAHAMSPMGGSGGNTAIRNAADLAITTGREGMQCEALNEFEQRMRERANERIEYSFRGGQKFWGGREWSTYGEVNI